MSSVTMTLTDAKLLARALYPHTDRDEGYYSVLSFVALGGELGQHAYATDRHTVAAYDLTSIVTDFPDETMVIPRKAVAFIRTIGKASLLAGESAYMCTLTSRPDDSRFVVSVHPTDSEEPVLLRSFYLSDVAKNKTFPPTARLFETFIPADGTDSALARTHLAPHTLSKLDSNAALFNSPARLTLGKRPTGNRTGMVLAEFGSRIKVLIAESLVLNPEGYGNDISLTNLDAHRKVQASTQTPDEESGEPRKDAHS